MAFTFFYENQINTTTQITPSTGTNTAGFLFDGLVNEVYQSSGDGSDLTTTTLTIEFVSTQNASNIVLQNINLKSFKIYYNSNSANLFSLTSDGVNTGTSEWSNNSTTNLYLQFATNSVKSIIIEATATMISDAEKTIGEMFILDKRYEFIKDPSAKEYKVQINRKEFSHEMSDGGIAVYRIAEKFKTNITRKYIEKSEYDDLKTIWQDGDPIVFCPEPTGTSWNNNIYTVNWIGAFTFEQYIDNYKGNGYRGQIQLREVAT